VAGLAIDRAELLGAEVGDFGLDVAFVGDGCGVELVALPVGEAFLTGAEEVLDPVERVGLAATVGPRSDAAADGGTRRALPATAERRVTTYLEHQTLRADAAGIDVIGGGAASDTCLTLLADVWGARAAALP